MSKRTNTCQIDHRGDPEPKDAPAPRRGLKDATRTPIRFRRDATPHTSPLEAQADTYGRCRAAAALEVPWSEDREDCAADLLISLLDAHGVTPPAVKYGNGRRRRPTQERRSVTAIPSGLPAARLTKLRWQAASWRRARKLERDRLLLDAAAPGALAAMPIDTGELDGTPRGMTPPHAEAMADGLADMLTIAGAAPSRRRDIAAAAYALLRDIDTSAAASETGRKPGAYREAARRGRAALLRAFPTPRDLFEALLLLDPPAMPARSRTHMLKADWRDWQAVPAPVQSSRKPGGRRKPRTLDDAQTAALARDTNANRAAAARRYR